MTDQIREQVSALLDGELPRDEIGLLVRRMERNPELRDRFGRYSTIGEALGAPGGVLASPGFAARVSAALDAPGQEEGHAVKESAPARTAYAAWLRPALGGALAASLALIAVYALQPGAQRLAAS
ncbi:MAG TPA: sigma-E factor negative regulatory protein, partial [Steroidobacteraceae bacterium]|nr:sigma-E factor negative regulatory protein [Steroidobacteraceae bacterium]